MDNQDDTGAGLVSLSAPDEIAAFTTLARLDAEAATAYRSVAAQAGDPDVRALLEAFEADHLRHVERLNTLITARGGAAVAPRADDALLGRLAAFAVTIGAEGAILSLLANEELTNASYDIAMAMRLDAETRAVLERNYADEQRHLDWARDAAQTLFEDDDELGGPADDEEEDENPKGAIEVVVVPGSGQD